jgi:hypothetical protein
MELSMLFQNRATAPTALYHSYTVTATPDVADVGPGLARRPYQETSDSSD